MEDCRQWVKSRMEDRRAKPCEFSQTAPPHKPSDSVSNATFSVSHLVILRLYLSWNC
ncbi:hypothetical protein Gotur_024228 [Gossypium turneri]